FQAFSREMKAGDIEVVETAQSKIAFLHVDLKRNMLYIALVSEKAAEAEKLFNFGQQLYEAMKRRDTNTLLSNAALFNRIVDRIYNDTFSLV
ncbi:MAG: hypothetical protein ACFFBD_18370, partial [Candidatus Hodarchaeota archaeon]